jgi:bifunctional non-homologous end joining protein LigD
VGLTEYKRKRNFAKTAEPKGKPLPKSVKGASRFVIQKHDASRLHYDFRLEMDGVLKSWAVPKGLPWKQGEKHLAVEVEDHPVDYATFEGIIPKGEYGGGTVMVWDRGKYYVYGENPLESLGKGRLHLVLDGKKAKGEWALIRIRGDGEKNQWLLLKATNSLKPITKKLDDQSVKTGRSMKQIADEQDAEWHSHRKDESPTTKFRARIQAAVAETGRGHKKKGSREDKKVKSGRRSERGQSKLDRSLEKLSLPALKPRFIEPMKPKLLKAPPPEERSYEIKFDGIRVIAVRTKGQVLLFSRNENDLSARFPYIVKAVAALPVRECVLDGEVVALDDKGRSSFQLLQTPEPQGQESPVFYYVFDLLQAEGKDIMPLPLERRRLFLEKIILGAGDPIRLSGEIGRDGAQLLESISRIGLEGIVGKRIHSVYESGQRTETWIKLKSSNQQEFVIGGYTVSESRGRKYFGAILIGYYERKKLRFAGKVGSGFSAETLRDSFRKLHKQERKTSPFADLSRENIQDLSPKEIRRCKWVNPVLIAQVKFAEWTLDGKLRHPRFVALREDKDPLEVRRE